MHSSLKILALALLLTVLTSCSVQPTQPSSRLWQEHQQQLNHLLTWQLKGKMGYQEAGNGGSAWIEWQQLLDTFNVRLSGPFGAGTTYLISEPGQTQLIQSGKAPLMAESASALSHHLFGWPWPVEDLVYWVRGIPSPHAPVESRQLDESQLLSTLKQRDWQLEFSRYRSENGWTLPGKIRGKRISGADSVSFTLVIKSWQIDSPSPIQPLP